MEGRQRAPDTEARPAGGAHPTQPGAARPIRRGWGALLLAFLVIAHLGGALVAAWVAFGLAEGGGSGRAAAFLASPTFSPTSTTALPTRTATPSATPTPSATATATFTPIPPTATAYPSLRGRVVIADYMMWYDPAIFDGRQTFDVPAAGPYNSDDPQTVARHVGLAQQACVDGLSPHWYGPRDARTTGNFEQLLALSFASNLRHAAVVLTNILPGADEALLTEAIQYLLTHWADHPNYLRLDGRPVVLFTDMTRPWGSEAAALAGWARIRAAADPEHRALWIAEGLFASYNPLFEGLYVYRLDHRDFPRSWLKQPLWARALRAVERTSGQRLYFADSIAPGFDDTRAKNAPIDWRLPAPPFARDRGSGQYYRETYAVTAQTGGDFLIVKSLNEWVEGTAIEPGTTYGDLYVNLTCEFANDYRSR